MTAFDCAVTNSPADALPIAPPQDPVFCRDNPSSCTTGSKRPLYAYNTPSNTPWIDNYNRAGYHASWSFPTNGAQNDICASPFPSSPSLALAELELTPPLFLPRSRQDDQRHRHVGKLIGCQHGSQHLVVGGRPLLVGRLVGRLVGLVDRCSYRRVLVVGRPLLDRRQQRRLVGGARRERHRTAQEPRPRQGNRRLDLDRQRRAAARRRRRHVDCCASSFLS